MSFDPAFMCNYTDNISPDDVPASISKLWSRSEGFSSIINNPLTNALLLDNLTTDKIIKNFTKDEILAVAIASLQAFVQDNFIGPKLSESFTELAGTEWPSTINARKLLIVDGEELNVNVVKPELLCICKHLLDCLKDADTITVSWWQMRLAMIHQKVLDELTDTLYNQFTAISEKLQTRIDEIDSIEYKTLMLLEVVQGLLIYRRIHKTSKLLEQAKSLIGTEFNVEGILGVRTKYQQKPLPQLALKVHINEDANLLPSAETHKNTLLPVLLKLDDDTRLEKITFISEEDNKIMELPAIVQIVVLNSLYHLKLSQPKDLLADEELSPFKLTLLYQPHGPWTARISTLLLNIELEANHKRTVERSLKQCEEVLNIVSLARTPIYHRLSYFFAIPIKTLWDLQSLLGGLMVSLGFIKTALDLYLKIQSWSDVIECYNRLELKHKAAEIIRQELEKNPTVLLYCLLGDAEDDIKYYEKAWEFSEKRSGRAQRHWGCYYFAKKDFTNAIDHLRLSLEINSLQEVLWLRLGYAALTLENWELAASAYRRYTQIEPHGFESWNNLAKAYINLGDKKRAHKILHEALKCNYNNWKVWENFLVVSIDTGHFEDTINAYNQLIVLKGKYMDKEVLEILVSAICENKTDASGQGAARLTKKALTLLGQLCVQASNEGFLWLLSSKLSESEPLAKAQKLQKAYRAFTQSQTIAWCKEEESCKSILELCEDLCLASLTAIKQTTGEAEKATALSQLSSARLSAQGCIKAASEEKWDNLAPLIATLKQLLEATTEELQKNL